jgi:hypothetical protein
MMRKEAVYVMMVTDVTHDTPRTYMRASWTAAIIFKTCHERKIMHDKVRVVVVASILPLGQYTCIG